ncbi:MAG: hypothetical protein IKQ13_13515, partial [Treponema sp.]|nr:hypothetical protein [Treponema sp.]
GEVKPPTPKRGFSLPLNPSLSRHGLGLCPKNPDLYFNKFFLVNVPFDKLRERNSFLPRSVEPWRGFF